MLYKSPFDWIWRFVQNLMFSSACTMWRPDCPLYTFQQIGDLYFGHNFSLRTPILMILDFSESLLRALQSYGKIHLYWSTYFYRICIVSFLYTSPLEPKNPIITSLATLLVLVVWVVIKSPKHFVKHGMRPFSLQGAARGKPRGGGRKEKRGKRWEVDGGDRLHESQTLKDGLSFVLPKDR